MPKYKTPVSSRQLAYKRQSGRCCYCDAPMWTTCADEFIREYGLSRAQSRWFQCTAEHLIARSDGGSGNPENIAAACRACNHRRHLTRQPLSPERYREYVRRRVAAGRWFDNSSPCRFRPEQYKTNSQ